MQPKKHSEDVLLEALDGLQGWSTCSRSTQSTRCPDRSPEALEVLEEHLQKGTTPAGLDYEELGGLLDLGQQDCSSGRNITWL